MAGVSSDLHLLLWCGSFPAISFSHHFKLLLAKHEALLLDKEFPDRILAGELGQKLGHYLKLKFQGTFTGRVSFQRDTWLENWIHHHFTVSQCLHACSASNMEKRKNDSGTQSSVGLVSF